MRHPPWRNARQYPAAVLVDTGAFYALSDAADRYHEPAVTLVRRLGESGTRLFTTELIVAETHALILARLRRIDTALDFLSYVYDSENTTIIDVTRDDQLRALALLNRYIDKRFSFTDATSFVVMERLRIPVAFTFDQNFVQYGVQVLGPQTG